METAGTLRVRRFRRLSDKANVKGFADFGRFPDFFPSVFLETLQALPARVEAMQSLLPLRSYIEYDAGR